MEPSAPKAQKKRRGCLWGCFLTLLVLLALLLLAGGGLAFLITRTPSLAKKMTPVAVTAEAAAGFEAKSQEVERLLGDTPQRRGRVRIEITQEEVTARLIQELERRDPPIPISKVQVNFKKDTMQVSAFLKMGMFNVPVVLRAEVIIQRDKALVEIKEIQVGSFPAPGFVRDLINDAIKKETEGLEFKLPENLESISIEEGMVVLEGS